MPGPPDKTRDPKNDDVRERSYYYDDAHGYEDFDPTAPDDEDDDGDNTSGGSAFDIDADGAPLAGVEPQESESAPGDVPDEDRDPDMDRL